MGEFHYTLYGNKEVLYADKDSLKDFMTEDMIKKAEDIVKTYETALSEKGKWKKHVTSISHLDRCYIYSKNLLKDIYSKIKEKNGCKNASKFVENTIDSMPDYLEMYEALLKTDGNLNPYKNDLLDMLEMSFNITLKDSINTIKGFYSLQTDKYIEDVIYEEHSEDKEDIDL